MRDPHPMVHSARARIKSHGVHLLGAVRGSTHAAT
jgi:hypothetical protein